MDRREDWPEMLNIYVASVQDKPFKYGIHDCALFVAGAIKEMTGKDFGRGFRRKYKDIKGYKKLLKSHGGLIGLVDSSLESKDLNFASRGDVVSFDTQNGEAIGICMGHNVAYISENGIVYIPTSKCNRAWGV